MNGESPRAAWVRLLPFIVFAVGVAIIWIPPWPPMADLPQQAAQAGLLKDLLLGRSPWAGEVWVNLFTPYLIGYALAVPLTMVMPVAAAMKLVLTGAYLAFGLVGRAIGREIGASRRLDAFYFASFFGFAYVWGLYTFLVAAPVGLAFVWLSLTYARRGGVARGLALTALGLALVFSHGLVFLLAWPIGLAILWVQDVRVGRALAKAWPFVPSLLVAVLIFWVTRRTEPELAGGLATQADFGPMTLRLFRFASGAFGLPGSIPIVAFILMAAAPFLGGLRLDLRRREALVIAGGVIGAAAVAPDWLWGTLFVQPRLTLFLPAAWAWLFSEPVKPQAAPLARARLDLAAGVAALLAIGPHFLQAIAFAAETKDFSTVLAKAAPGRRGLGLVVDLSTKTGVDPAVYEYFPSWYQAEKHGFVDYNLAEFHAEVVRFRVLPPVYAAGVLPLEAIRFDWRRDGGDRYDYFFVRSSGPVPATLFAGAPCQPALLALDGEWKLFERAACAAPHPGQRAP